METSNTVEVKKVREDSVDSTPLIVANSKKEIDVPQPTEEKASITIVIGRKPNTNSELLKPEDMQIKIPNADDKMSRRAVKIKIMPSGIEITNIGSGTVKVNNEEISKEDPFRANNNIQDMRNLTISIGPHIFKAGNVKGNETFALQTLIYKTPKEVL